MIQWLQEQAELRALSQSAAKTERAFTKELAEAKAAKKPYSHISMIEHGEYFEMSTIEDQIDWVKTRRIMRKAQRYSIPLPKHIEGEDWRPSDRLGFLLLTDVGALKIRREIATEVDINQKPWLNWLSLFISGASLAVAIWALTSSHEQADRTAVPEASITRAPAAISDIPMNGTEPLPGVV